MLYVSVPDEPDESMEGEKSVSELLTDSISNNNSGKRVWTSPMKTSPDSPYKIQRLTSNTFYI